VHAVEGVAGWNRLEGNHNVVQASEFECVAQTIPFSPYPMPCGATKAQRIGTTTLYSNSPTKG
jgi:hypothetical protein